MTGELIERPNFIPSADSEATQEDNALMNQYCQPPRIKIIQAMSQAPFKPPFKEKDVIVVPQMIKVAGEGEPFTFTPIYFFPTWACWNPIKMRAQLPAVREFTFDSKDPIAQKARKFVYEPCPENPEYKLRYCEHLNFYYVIHGVPDLKNIPLIHSFFRGEYKTGQALIGLIQTRNAPKYSCRLQGIPTDHIGKEGTWAGLDIVNDSQLWVTEEEFNRYRKLAESIKALVDTRSVEINYDDSDVENNVVPATTNSDF